MEDEFIKVNIMLTMLFGEGPRGWRPPSGDCIKLNVDASVNPFSKEAVAEVVARNSEGTVLMSAAYKLLNIDSVLYAELQPFFKVLSWHGLLHRLEFMLNLIVCRGLQKYRNEEILLRIKLCDYKYYRAAEGFYTL
ncbi:hypothetical protein PTKIN_Ptkin09bG0048600 [Pterospermum kingtungense]